MRLNVSSQRETRGQIGHAPVPSAQMEGTKRRGYISSWHPRPSPHQSQDRCSQFQICRNTSVAMYEHTVNINVVLNQCGKWFSMYAAETSPPCFVSKNTVLSDVRNFLPSWNPKAHYPQPFPYSKDITTSFLISISLSSSSLIVISIFPSGFLNVFGIFVVCATG